MEILEEVRGKHPGVSGMSKALVQVRLCSSDHSLVSLFNIICFATNADVGEMISS